MPSFRNYTWEDTVTISIIKLATINKCIDYKVIPHTESLEDSTVFQFEYDGMHEIVRIILPTFEWY
jgi:hypothetical protein